VRVRIFPAVIWSLIVIGFVIVMAVVYRVCVPGEAHVQGNWSGIIWKSGGDAALKLYKIQDGNCSIYVVGDNVRMAIATGAGCK
jgi:hypothetical protein